MDIQHGRANQTRVVDQFNADDLGAPFKVILNKCVRVVTDNATGEILSYNIPDPDGLLRMVVMARILHSRKLFGPDIKFLRKAVSVKQKDLAPKIEMSPEHLSRCETGDVPIGPGSEKLLRLFLFKTVIKHHKFKECEAKTRLEEALDKLFDIITPVAAHGIEDELVFYFSRRAKSSSDAGTDDPGEDDDGWKDGVLSAVA